MVVPGVRGQLRGFTRKPEGLVEIPFLPFGTGRETGHEVRGEVGTIHVPIIHVIAGEKLV